MTIPNLISRAEADDGFQPSGRGRITKQASVLLTLIENQIAHLITHAEQNMTHLLAGTTKRADDE